MRHRILRRDGRLFWHPYTLGTMPNHPTNYAGRSLFHDRSTWVVQLRVPWGAVTSIEHTPRSRWRVVALWHALRGHTEARP